MYHTHTHNLGFKVLNQAEKTQIRMINLCNHGHNFESLRVEMENFTTSKREIKNL